jgi:hypothetical protein
VPAVAAPPGRLESLIVGEYPPLFEEFRAKRFNLLWRGSRDGFGAKEFHRRCDGRANTLTLIVDTDGNVFGGFTSVEWESREWNGMDCEESNCCKGDDSAEFPLHAEESARRPAAEIRAEGGNEAPRNRLRFQKGSTLWQFRIGSQQYTIRCDSARCAVFGDIWVSDNCNANRDSFTAIGTRWSPTPPA